MRSFVACRRSIFCHLVLLLVMVPCVPNAGIFAERDVRTHGHEKIHDKAHPVDERKQAASPVQGRKQPDHPVPGAHPKAGVGDRAANRKGGTSAHGSPPRSEERKAGTAERRGNEKKPASPTDPHHARPGRPRAGLHGGVALDPPTGLVLITDGTGRVHLATLSEEKRMSGIPVRGTPHDVAVDAGRRLALITLRSHDRLALYTLPEMQPAGYVTTARHPLSLAHDALSGLTAVITGDGAVELIDIERRAKTAVDPGKPAHALAMQEGEQRLWVTLEGGHGVAVIETGQGTVLARISAGRTPGAISVSTRLRLAAVANRGEGTVSLIDIDELREKHRVSVDITPDAVVFDDEGGQLLVMDHAAATVLRLDASAGQVIEHIEVKKHPIGMAVDAGNRRAVIAHRGGKVSFIALSDTRPPEVRIDFPPDGWLTAVPDLELQGSLNETATLTIDGQLVAVDEERRFVHRLLLRDGVNVIELVAVDEAGNTGVHVLRVELDRDPPAAPLAGLISLLADEGEMVRVHGASGSVEAGALVRVINARTGAEVSVIAGTDGSFTARVPGSTSDRYVIRVEDGAGNQGSGIEIGGEDLPPDPGVIAPSAIPGATGSFADLVGFLIEGARPVQREAEQGVIDPARAAVLRGRVLTASGAPLPGVRVGIQGHPEFGHTLTRHDGMFDMVVNGGGWTVLSYDREGHLPAQRRIEVPRNDFAWLPDVIMLTLDPQVTSVLMDASEVQIARGSVVSDADGERQLTMIFPAGTSAELLLADGSTLTSDRLSVRATEYTLSGLGPAAMPGELPPTSAWTYAVELSADEAMSAGASEVRFNRPVGVWVENFPGFPVGTAVPSAWYDRERASWIPDDDGRVIAITDVIDGRAVLDIDGRGVAASQEELDELGVDDGELRALGMLYRPGAVLWRVPVRHFTPWDFNWPHGPPQDAVAPEVKLPEPDPQSNEPECRPGSIIECENQVLSEALRIAGTEQALHYRSDRVPGRRAAWTIDIPVSGAAVPASLRRIDLELMIAGRQFRHSYQPAPGLRHQFVWDGRDAYGRPVYGAARLSVRIGYVYQTVYYQPANAPRSFSLPGVQPLFGVGRTSSFTVWASAVRMLGGYDARVAGLGGWTLSPHHAWDAATGTLHRGDGTRRMIGGREALITTIAGGDETGFSGDGGPALSARFGYPIGLAVDAGGSIYVADGAFFLSDRNGNRRVRRIAPDGVITTLAGGGSDLGDGGPANLARLAHPADVAVGPDGSVYIADGGMPDRSDPAAHRIRRVFPDGTIATVAGTGEAGYSGDGGPAIEARLNAPMGIAVGADGSLYISDWLNSRIRRVDPDGIITTLAGSGVWGSGGDGGLAIETPIRSPAGIAVAGDGAVYFADWSDNRIRRIGVDGIITTVAGGALFGDPGASGVPALAALLMQPTGIALAADGSIYIADQSGSLLRRVGPDGIITTVAGDGRWGVAGDGGVARDAQLAGPNGVAIGPGDAIYVSEQIGRVRRIAEPAFLRAADGTHTVPAAHGQEVYRFDSLGRHLDTRDALTGAVLYRFRYEDDGSLAAIEDRMGKVLRIEREVEGGSLAITAPDGTRTAMTLNSEGWLSSFTDPEGATHELMYGADGLLAAVLRPLGGTSAYTYDAAGRLRDARDALGGGSSLMRTQASGLTTVTVASAEGLATEYRARELAGGERIREVWMAGAKLESSIASAGRRTDTSADGTVTTIKESPDPRFALEAPLTETTVTTPAGVSAFLQIERSLEGTDTPSGWEALIERITADDGVYEARFDRGESVWTLLSPAGRSASVSLDDLGRIRSRSGALSIDYEYDGAGHLSALDQRAGDDQRRWRFAYEASGGLSSLIDPLARETSFEYDASGRLIRQTMPGGRTLSYEWDAEARLAEVAAPGGMTHAFAWSAHGLLQEYAMPALQGAIGFQYDLDRRPVGITLPSAAGIGLSYDAAGRPAVMSLEQGRLEYSYDEAGRPLSATAPGGVVLSWTWDGFLPVEEYLSGETVGSVGWHWDKGFALRGIELGSYSLLFEHDADGLLTRAGDLQLQRDSATGLPTGLALGEIIARRSYNAFGEPAGLEVLYQGSTIARFEWDRDRLGRLTTISEVLQGEALETAYEYDDAGRLVGVLREGILGTMEHDADGNLIRVNGQVVAEYDQSGRLLRFGAERFEYDHIGALALRVGPQGSVRHAYDPLGNLRRAELADGRVVEYVIDARNRRVGRRIDGALSQGFLYADQWRPIAELDGSGSIRSVFVYGDRLNVPVYMIRDGRTYLIVADHVGSPRLVVDSADGRIVQRIDYDPLGRVLRDTNPGFQPFGFAGGLYDPDTGLVRFGARDYDPSVGRWTSLDLLGPAGGDTNPYVYVAGDPVNFIDPQGSFALNAAAAAVGAAAGAFMAVATGESVIAGLVGGAIAGAFPGGGAMANLAIGAVSGIVSDFVGRLYARCQMQGANGVGMSMLSSMIGSALGRYLGMLNGAMVARAGEGAGRLFDQSTALVSAYHAQTVSGSMAGAGAAVLMRGGEASR